MFRLIKWTVLGVAGAVILGVVFFGTDCFSYAKSSFRLLRGTVKNAVPLDFELRRARDLLADLVPEIQANVVVVAQEEVGVDALAREVQEQRRQVEIARATIKGLKDNLIGPIACSATERREAVVDLSRRFANLTLAEKLLAGKEKVLEARRGSLEAAVQALREAQIRKVELEAEIEKLEHEVRIMRNEGQVPPIVVDRSALVKAETLVAELRKRLDLAQKILVCQSAVGAPQPPRETEQELFARIDGHLAESQRAAGNGSEQ